MKLTVLGSGTFRPVKNRSNPGYLLDIAGKTILLDGGSGTLRQIVKADRSFWEIQLVFYSHLHLDHIAEFIPFLFTRKYTQSDCTAQEVIFYGHENFHKYFSELSQIFNPWIDAPNYPFTFQPLKIGRNDIGNLKLDVFHTNHTPESLIFRFIENDKTFVYTGDTDLSNELVTACRNADCVLTECSNTDANPIEGHLTPNKISQLAELAKPRKILLTHISPENDYAGLVTEIRCSKEISIQIVEDLEVFTI